MKHANLGTAYRELKRPNKKTKGRALKLIKEAQRKQVKTK